MHGPAGVESQPANPRFNAHQKDHRSVSRESGDVDDQSSRSALLLSLAPQPSLACSAGPRHPHSEGSAWVQQHGIPPIQDSIVITTTQGPTHQPQRRTLSLCHGTIPQASTGTPRLPSPPITSPLSHSPGLLRPQKHRHSVIA